MQRSQYSKQCELCVLAACAHTESSSYSYPLAENRLPRLHAWVGWLVLCKVKERTRKDCIAAASRTVDLIENRAGERRAKGETDTSASRVCLCAWLGCGGEWRGGVQGRRETDERRYLNVGVFVSNQL